MVRLVSWMITAGIALMLSVGCSSINESSDTAEADDSSKREEAMEETQVRPPAPRVDPRLVSGNTRFGIKLYGAVLKKSDGKNVFISPSSVSLALSMTWNGAAGTTKETMARALELQGMSAQEVNQANAQLRASLESTDPRVLLQIANSLWAHNQVAFKAEFMRRNQEFYAAEVSTLDFSSPAAPATINSWVKRKTGDKIEKIIDEIGGDSILFVINAIYFKGKWTDQFDKSKTKEDVFTTGAGAKKNHPMMSQSGSYAYYEGDGFQAVSLPYGDRRISMYIFLPSASSSLDEFHRSLTPENWEGWLTRFTPTKGDIVIPRFKVEYEIELNDALKSLGMAEAFDAAQANFSAMLEPPQGAFISKVKHKTFAEVNEEGTEAAAVTSVEVATTSLGPPPQRFRMVVDRPFFCVIRDNHCGTVLFMGSITDPL